MEALDAQHAWVVMERRDAPGATLPAELYYTADGGLSWTPRSLPAGNTGMSRPCFLTTTEGLTIGSTGIIYRTTDGGQTWQAVTPQPVAGPNQFSVSGLHAVPGLLWATVNNQSAPGTLWLSTDRGLSWRSQALPAATYNIGAVFRDARHALLFTGSGLLATADGGQTWTPATDPPFRFGLPTASLTAVPGSRAYVAGAFAITGATAAKGSAVSYDDGQTWTPLETANSYLSVQFAGPAAGWHIRAEYYLPTVQYEYQGVGRYTGPALGPLATASTPARTAGPAEAFPNPSTDGFFRLQVPPTAGRVRQVRVLDGLGRAVYQAPTLPTDQRLDLSRQPKGLYSLEIQTETGLLRRKLLTH